MFVYLLPIHICTPYGIFDSHIILLDDLSTVWGKEEKMRYGKGNVELGVVAVLYFCNFMYLTTKIE